MKDVETYPLDDVGLLARAIGNTIRKNMGGTSGVLYDIFFTAAADKLTKVANGSAKLRARSCWLFHGRPRDDAIRGSSCG